MARAELIQVRRGTATQWSDANPVLDAGEPGFDLTNDIFKIGDGTSAWADLPSIAGGGGGGSVAWVDITGKPTFGTASAEDVAAFATGAEGDLAASALQPGDGLAALDSTANTKLSGIATGATANDTDAELRDRTTHTGAQAISTVTGLQTALDAKADESALGTAAAADTGDFATAAQGATADTAVQPAAIAALVTGASGSGGVAAVTDIVAITQTDYTALGTPDAGTVYLIVGA